MIPAAFAYHRPTSVKEAVGLLAQLGEEGRALAGGHSLIPMMKLRLATPEHLIDLAGVLELKGIRTDGGDIVIGAMTTQHELIASELLSAKIPLLRETSLVIADPQVRYVGTLGGNVANGDPGNDMPAVMMCLGASYQVASQSGKRRIASREFYQGAYFTTLEPGEIVTEIRTAANPLDVTINPLFDPRANAVTSRSISLASRMSTGLNSTPNDGATDWIEANWPIPAGMVGSRRTAARVTPGAISLSSSSHFPLMPYSKVVNPVALPPGRAKLATKPAATGSGVCANTIGTVRVACSNGPTIVPPEARMTSGASATNSAAYLRVRSVSPAPQR